MKSDLEIAQAAKMRPVLEVAEELGIAATTLYSRVKEYGLKDRDAPSYAESFEYTRGNRLDDYLPLIFSAALSSASGKAKDAVANLRISQGYFYKVMKRVK